MKYIVLALMLCSCIGPRGDQGIQGPAGVNGTNGTNATPVTWVQFCPGIPSYPSTFIEGGLCISGNVYAVYSENDGFMTSTLLGRIAAMPLIHPVISLF